MTIGGSIAVIAIGAALTFAVTVDPPGLNLDVLGVILMVAGAVLLTLRLKAQQARRVRRLPSGAETIVVEEPVSLDEPPVVTEPPILGDERERGRSD